MSLYVLYLSLFITLSSDDLRNRIESGRRQFEILINDENSDPLCWKENIIILMNQECSSLNYELRSNIALKLAICHLKQSGIDNLNDIESVQQISSNHVVFSTYNQFFTHIDNICIYVQMRENEKNLKKSISNLYTATIESTDYMIQSHEKQKKFENEILKKQRKIKETNDEILRFNEEHKENINNLELIASNIQHQQQDISDKQRVFQNKQNKFYETIINIDSKQQDLIENQQKIDENVHNLHKRHSIINDNIKSSISLQEESINKQQNIYKMQNIFHNEMKQNNEKIDYFFEESSEKQNNILIKQENTFNTISNIELKTNKLEKQSIVIQNEMNKMYESQKMEINNAKKEIEELTEKSQNAYKQITSMFDEVLFILNAIYSMDITILQQFISIQSIAFYLFWCIISYIATIPKSARSARIVLFVGLIISIIFEKTVISFIPYTSINKWCIMIRKAMFSINAALYIWFILTYKDINQQQIQLLHQINTSVHRHPRTRSKRIWWRSALNSITPKNRY